MFQNLNKIKDFKVFLNEFSSFLINIYKKINNFFNENQAISFLAVFSFFFIIFTIIYMRINPIVSSDDHYFHIRFAQKMFENGFFNSFYNFKSIYFTNVALGEYFIYYNFLFYLALLPFTFITPLFLAIKLYAITVIALIGTFIYFFIKKINVKYPFYLTIGFFAIVGHDSIWRLLLSRPYVFAPIFLLLLVLAIYKRKYFWIFTLSFLYLFWHTATFPLPLLIGIIYFVATYIYKKKIDWKILSIIFSAVLLSLVVVILISPGFLNNISYNVLGLIGGIIGKVKINIPEGGEVYSKNFFDFLNSNIFLVTMYISSIIYYIGVYFEDKRNNFYLDESIRQKKVIMMILFFLSSVFFVAISLISYRFSDFFIFFAWFFIVINFDEIMSYLVFTKLTLKKYIKYIALICLVYLFLSNCLQLGDSLASGSKPETFMEVGNYLSKNLNKGDIVFNVSWNWFPQLYYYAPEQNYVIGLEPKLTYLYSQKIYWLWTNIGNGYVCEKEKCLDEKFKRDYSFRKKETFLQWSEAEGDKIAEVIVKDFKSHYIISSDSHSYLNSVLNNNKNFKRVLSSNGYFVYKILDN